MRQNVISKKQQKAADYVIHLTKKVLLKTATYTVSLMGKVREN